MTATYTPSLGLALPGLNDTGWGTTVNNGITSLVDTAIAGYLSITMTSADFTLTTTDGASNQARNMMLNIAGTPGAARNVICPAKSKLYFVKNSVDGGFAVTLKTPSGTGVSIPNGRSMVLMCDGTNVREAADFTTTINTTNLAYTGTLTGGTGVVNLGSGQFYKDASGNVGVGTTTPAVKLDVIGAGDGGLQYRTGTRTVGIGQTASEASVYWGSTTPLTFFSGTERMRIDSSGNVGIGGTATNRLDVFHAVNGIGARLRNTSTSVEIALRTDATTAGLDVGNASGGMTFSSNTNELMRIDASGNQINTPSNTPPTLTVNGQMNLTPTSNTNMRISYRGSDGVTRVGNITLA